jgi:hypothetical protein
MVANVRLERERHFVAKAPLHAGADRAQEPRRRGRQSKTDGGGEHEDAAALEHTVAEQHQPQRQERVGERRQQ